MTWATYSWLLLWGHCHQVLPFVTVIALTQALLDWNYKIWVGTVASRGVALRTGLWKYSLAPVLVLVLSPDPPWCDEKQPQVPIIMVHAALPWWTVFSKAQELNDLSLLSDFCQVFCHKKTKSVAKSFSNGNSIGYLRTPKLASKTIFVPNLIGYGAAQLLPTCVCTASHDIFLGEQTLMQSSHCWTLFTPSMWLLFRD